jgi:hypothetical protein
VAKGNDGNYLQHSVEVAVALHLIKLSTQGGLHLALTHGMEPFERCGKLPNSRCLQEALQAAQNPPTCGESPIVAAYRATKASLENYPNTGELLAAMIGRGRLSPGGVLSCPATLRAPWLFAADPMTFRQDGYLDDDRLYQEDLSRLSTTLKGFIASGEPGMAAIFVYSVKPDVQPQFWAFADVLAADSGAFVVSCWMTHQDLKRNLAALFYSSVALPANWLPHGVNAGR